MTKFAGSANKMPINSSTGEYQRYLHKRGNIFYFKASYPQEVHDKLRGKSPQKWKSLGTHDYVTAQTKLDLEITVFEDEVKRMRTVQLPGPARSVPFKAHPEVVSAQFFEGQLPQLMTCLEYDLLQQDDDYRCHASDEQIGQRLEGIGEELKRLKSAIFRKTYDVAAQELDEMLQREKVRLPPATKLRAKVQEAFTRKYSAVLAIILDRYENQQETTAAPIRLREMLTLRDVYSKWSQATNKKGKKPVHRTQQTHWGYVGEFTAMFGAVPVAAISHEMCNQYKAKLVESGLERRSVENHFGGLRALVGFEMRKMKEIRKLHVNPFVGMTFDDLPTKSDSEKRRAFEQCELQQLLKSKVYTQGYRPRGQVGESAYWTPLIALFAGMRIEEVAQLSINDICSRGGIWVIRICELSENQKTKTNESKRDVPIHDELLKCGFLRYAADVKLAGHERLFPSLTCKNKNKLFSNALTKWFSRYIDGIGIDDPRVCFHSLRRCFGQAATEAMLGQELRCALMGHWCDERTASGKIYVAEEGKKYPIRALAQGMKRIEFVGLDLSALHVAEPFLNVEAAFGALPPNRL